MLLSLATGVVAGCVTPPKSQVTDELETPAAPETWDSEETAGDFDPLAWTDDFNDRQLEALIEEALSNNFSLQAAYNRLEAARQTAVISGAGQWPNVSVSHSGGRAQRNTDVGGNNPSDSFALTGRVSWEFDLWGRVRNETRAGMADYQASLEEYRSAKLALAARIAGVWFDLLEAEAQLELSRRNLVAFRNNLEIVEEQFRRGISQALDVHLVRANLAGAESSYELRLRQRGNFIRLLEVLLGRYPAADIAITSALPETLPPAPAGLPQEIVFRRPDLIAAERRLAAQSERAAAAFKDRLPNIVLTASGGTSSDDFGQSFDITENQVWALAYNITMPIFQGGRLKAQEERAKATFELAKNNFVDTLLNAYREVENTLEAEGSLERDVLALRVATDESIAAEQLAWDQYSRGLSGIITALESQRRAISAERTLLQTQNERLQARIDLYLVLGGGLVVDPADAEPIDIE